MTRSCWSLSTQRSAFPASPAAGDAVGHVGIQGAQLPCHFPSPSAAPQLPTRKVHVNFIFSLQTKNEIEESFPGGQPGSHHFSFPDGKSNFSGKIEIFFGEISILEKDIFPLENNSHGKFPASSAVWFFIVCSFSTC